MWLSKTILIRGYIFCNFGNHSGKREKFMCDTETVPPKETKSRISAEWWWLQPDLELKPQNPSQSVLVLTFTATEWACARPEMYSLNV